MISNHALVNDTISGFANKKIIIVLGGLELGGSERQALHLARYFKKLNARIEIWGFGKPGRLTELCDESNIPWRTVPVQWMQLRSRRNNAVERFGQNILGLYCTIRNICSLYRFALELRQWQPDLILPYTMTPNVFCCSLWRWSKAKACVWNQRDEGMHFMGSGIERYAAKRASFFVTNSAVGKDFLTTQYGVCDDKVSVVHNGVIIEPPRDSTESWKRRLSLGESSFVACMIANLLSSKDHATLLKAWKTVIGRTAADNVHAVLLLAGAYKGMEESLKALAYDLGLCSHIIFLGPVDDIAGMLSVCDLGVFSSNREGCPNGVLECMAVGLPVVATDIPGIREAVGPEGFPYLAPPGDTEGLADRILKFYRNRDMGISVGRKNSARIKDHFSVHRMQKETVSLLNSRLNKIH